MITCPNKNLPEWQELEQLVPDLAYTIWDLNNGNGIDKAPNGAESILFKSLLEHHNGDRNAAIQAKAKVYSNEFREWFGDWVNDDKTNVSKVVDENGEPLIVYHGTKMKYFGFDTIDLSKQDDNISFFTTSNKNMAKSYTDVIKTNADTNRIGKYIYHDYELNLFTHEKIDQYGFATNEQDFNEQIDKSTIISIIEAKLDYIGSIISDPNLSGKDKGQIISAIYPLKILFSLIII